MRLAPIQLDAGPPWPATAACSRACFPGRGQVHAALPALAVRRQSRSGRRRLRCLGWRTPGRPLRLHPGARMGRGPSARVLLSLNTATASELPGQGPVHQTGGEDLRGRRGARVSTACTAWPTPTARPGSCASWASSWCARSRRGSASGRCGIDRRPRAEPQLRTTWSASALDWRCRNPNNPAFVRVRDSVVQVYARGVNPLVQAYAELPRDRLDLGSVPARGERLMPFRLYLGLEPGDAAAGGLRGHPPAAAPFTPQLHLPAAGHVGAVRHAGLRELLVH